LTSLDLYKTLNPSVTEVKEHVQVLADGISCNLSDFYTKLIKDAARCNRYSSDIVFDINEINEKLKTYRNGREFEPVWIGFRRHGVDGTSYVVSAITEQPDLQPYQRYFALYSVMVEDGDPGWCKIIINEYWM